MNQVQHWNKIYSNGRKFSEVSEIVLDKLGLKGKTVLDIGCGTGELMRQLKARGFEVTGIDLSDVGIHQAKQIEPSITYLVGDFMRMETDKQFDVVVANKVIAFNDLDLFTKKVASALSDAGMFVLITPVTYRKYRNKYSNRLKSISVDFDKLSATLEKYFTSFNITDARYFEDYGCELTITAGR